MGILIEAWVDDKAAQLERESQSPKAGHGYSDGNESVNVYSMQKKSQSPKAGHGYSDLESALEALQNYEF